jgi:hypothetical protein
VAQFGEGSTGMDEREIELLLLLLLLLLASQLLVEGIDSGYHQRVRDEGGLMDETITREGRLKRSRGWTTWVMMIRMRLGWRGGNNSSRILLRMGTRTRRLSRLSLLYLCS